MKYTFEQKRKGFQSALAKIDTGNTRRFLENIYFDIENKNFVACDGYKLFITKDNEFTKGKNAVLDKTQIKSTYNCEYINYKFIMPNIELQQHRKLTPLEIFNIRKAKELKKEKIEKWKDEHNGEPFQKKGTRHKNADTILFELWDSIFNIDYIIDLNDFIGDELP